MSNFHNLSGEQKNQLLIVTDKKGNKIGVATREECHESEGKTHLAFVAFLIDKDNKIILTKRSGKKSLWPNFWDAASISHVLPGETVEEAAQRRGKEELGVEVIFKDIGAFYYFAKHGDSCENEYCHVLMGYTDKQIVLNPVEIAEIKKITFNKLIKELEDHPDKFTPWFKLGIKRLHLDKGVTFSGDSL